MQHVDHEHDQPDAWHRHTAAEGAPQAEHASRVNALGVTVVLAGLTVAVIFVIIISVIYLNSYRSQLIAERQDSVHTRADYLAYRAKMDAELSAYGWASQSGGLVVIPIDQAGERALEMYNDNSGG